jgi:hypothetical protein
MNVCILDDISQDALRLVGSAVMSERKRRVAGSILALIAPCSRSPTPDWQRRLETIRTLVQRIDIGFEVIKIIFRVQNARGSESESISITNPTLSL